MGETMSAKRRQTVNGVDVTALVETIEAIKERPAIAKFTFRAANRWQGGGLNETAIADFDGACRTHRRARPFVLRADEPPVLLGEDRSANPVEYVLHALAACLTTSLVYHAAARGIAVQEVESTLEGSLDLQGFLGLSENARRGYEQIRVTFKIKADGPESQLEELCRMAQQYSPVFDIVSNGVPVSVELAR